ncbi:hypothetical protein LWI29_019016 [Acer saccharum]|uniref:Auxin efflux carrier component n=1 Tax=Acer saccharum TaxID=4024 RepID=A0AA39RPX1_ACESA|nr:hypothetical protein LWI29_019016 [Acer saccharum]
MITGDDFYKVMCAMVPLYFAMLVAYASVKWWRIFTPEQCSGINRFVAVFAVPVLSFHFIAQNNPYQMDTKFILADTLSKIAVLVLLSVCSIFFNNGGCNLDWLITLFSVATLPNTLVMGIPLLNAMYGDFTRSLMVQLVVLQCIIWYTLLLFLFEYRAATLLIQTRFPGPDAASITKFELDNDVISLDGRDPLRTESETDGNGRIRVRIRRSTSSAPDSALSSSLCLTPRASNLSNAEIFSINTPAPLHEYHNYNTNNDIVFWGSATSPRLSGYASSDAYSLQPTPRASNFNEMDTITVMTTGNTPTWARSPVAGKAFRQASPVVAGVKTLWESPGKFQGDIQGCKDVAAAGLFMALQPRIIACGAKRATMGMVIRFIFGPIVMSAASLAVGLRSVTLHAAIVQAALPQGIVPFVFAREYGLHPDILSTGVIFGMLVSLPVTLLYYILLGL